MSFDSFSFLLLTITILVPGYIVSRIIELHRARRREESQVEFLRWIVIGAACIAPWVAVMFPLLSEHLTDRDTAWAYIVDHALGATVAWVIAIFVWPVLIALIYSKFNFYRFVTSRSGLTAWDSTFVMTYHDQGVWLLVVLADGNRVAGEFAEGSHASVDPGERDLYISKVHFTSYDSEFKDLSRQGGILIPAAQIRVVRFWQ
jgi:Family of unknown function (DUF6338)